MIAYAIPTVCFVAAFLVWCKRESRIRCDHGFLLGDYCDKCIEALVESVEEFTEKEKGPSRNLDPRR